MRKSRIASAVDRAKQAALVATFGLLWVACSGTSHDGQGRGIWDADSAGIDFTLDSLGQHLCDFSATREQLTGAQRDGLSSLGLHDAIGGAGCDGPAYEVTIRARAGSSKSYMATAPVCESPPSLILLFEDFDAWAKSTTCFVQR